MVDISMTPFCTMDNLIHQKYGVTHNNILFLKYIIK